jgi:ABC-type transport system involved in multi-copper enzyme maturation permease subunit
MLTLIGREIRDHLVYVLGPCVVGLLLILLAIRPFAYGNGPRMLLLLIPLMSLPLVFFYILGTAQMYGDRAHRVSTLLSTLAVTRNRILAARVLVGLLTVLASVVPLVVAVIVLLRLFTPGAQLWYPLVVEVSITIALTGFACYCVGLLIGWTSIRVWLLAGSLPLLATISLVFIKGFGPEAMAVLLLLIAAVLLRVWHKFTSTSL